jgi:hypothetical protein
MKQTNNLSKIHNVYLERLETDLREKAKEDEVKELEILNEYINREVAIGIDYKLGFIPRPTDIVCEVPLQSKKTLSGIIKTHLQLEREKKELTKYPLMVLAVGSEVNLILAGMNIQTGEYVSVVLDENPNKYFFNWRENNKEKYYFIFPCEYIKAKATDSLKLHKEIKEIINKLNNKAEEESIKK